jgi:hypothetical protein
MNNRFRNLGTCAGLSAAALFLAAGAAFGADVPLSTLNGGPSSDSIPGAADDPVAFMLAPREIIDPTIANNLPIADLNNNSLDVQDSADPTGTGVRNRSRAVMAVFDTNSTTPPALIFQANLNYNPLVANSYFLFLSAADAATINTIGELDSFIAGGTAGTDFVRIFLDDVGFTGGSGGGGDFVDGDITDANLNAGALAIAASDFLVIDPGAAGAADGNVGSAVTFEVGILVFSDGGGAGADIPTEFFCVRTDPTRVAPTDAALDPANNLIRVVASEPLITDGDGTIANSDTTPGSLTGADFRVRLNGAGASQSLTQFLANLGTPRSVTGVTVTGDFNTIFEIALDGAVAAGTDETLVLNSTIGFNSETSGGQVYSFAGEDPNPDLATFQSMDRAADLGFGTVQLLQGTGQSGFGNGATDVWVAIDFDDTINVVGDNNQFELLDAEGNVIATSNLVQDTLPSNVDVLGIDDANLDGTATDNVIETANNRLFARFSLADGDDSINSDATWSDDGQDDINNRDERSAISIRLADGFAGTTAQTALGGTIDPDSSATLSDLARPIAIGFLTRAGDTGEFCEFVDSLDFIFDETVQTNANTSTFVFLGYNSGEEISDLTTGLGAGLSIPTIDIVTTATVNDRRLTPGSLALTTNFVSNDTATLGAPEVPVDGTANDGSTEILTGTGDTGYIIAHRNGAVSDAGGRLVVALGTFGASPDFELSGGFETVSDGAAPALMGANSDDALFQVLAGFSEDVFNVNGTDEAETLFVIMENDEIGRRFNIENGDVDFLGDNTVEIDLPSSLDSDIALDPGYNLSVFNPGHDIEDIFGNAIDPNIAKTKLVLITPPAAAFKTNGVAIVDEDTDKVIEIRLQVTGPVELSEDGDIGELASRFFLRGDEFGFPGDNDGDSQELGGLIEDIEIADEPNSDGCYEITLFLMEGMPFPQEDFYVEYTSTTDLEEPADSFLVTPVETGDVEIASEVVYVRVLRAPVDEGDENSPDGNPLTMTIVGNLDLDGANALGSRVTAWVWKADEGTGSFSFTYKGVVHTGSIDGVSNGEVRYFHPQLLGDGLGAVEPMGILNRKPELDITATVVLDQDGNDIETLVYQRLDNLGVPAIIRPLQVTFRDDPTCPGRFTFTGSGITNGVVTYPGEFEEIGSTVITSPVLDGEDEETGARPFALHTRGSKSFRNCPVVIVVEPETFFAPDADCFLANNMLFPVASAPNARALTFQSDIDRTGANALPIVFNINSANSTVFDLNENYEQDDWAILPIPTNQGDRGTTGNLPNRVSSGATILTAQGNIDANISARGAFVALDIDDCVPVVLDVDLALAIDNRGVFCGDVCNLNRVATGYAYAISSDDLDNSDLRWYTFGPRFTSGATLAVATNNSNGGWNLLANLRNAAVATGSFGGQVNITMDSSSGVRVWANGFGDTNDLSEIGVNEGVLVHTTSAFNSTP